MTLTKASVVIASTNPSKLSKFYSLVIDSSVSEGFTEHDYELRMQGGCQISFYKPTSKRESCRISPPSLAICFQKKPSSDPESDIANWVNELVSYGGRLIDGPIVESFGVEAWMIDQEDNKFMIFVPFITS